MTVPHAVAYEAVTLVLARDRGVLDESGLREALSAIASDVETQADAFDLLYRLAGLASRAVGGLAHELGTDPESLLQEAAASHAATKRLVD